MIPRFGNTGGTSILEKIDTLTYQTLIETTKLKNVVVLTTVGDTLTFLQNVGVLMGKKLADKVISVRLTNDQYDQLKKNAEISGESLATVCRVMLTRQLGEQNTMFGGFPTPGLDQLSPFDRWQLIRPVDVTVALLRKHGMPNNKIMDSLSLTKTEIAAMIKDAKDQGLSSDYADVEKLES